MNGFFKSFGYAFAGIRAGWKGQRNIKVMAAVAGVVVVFGWQLGITAAEWAVVALACAVVFSLELMNTAGEKLVDILSPEINPRFGEIKDIMAGAVLVAAIFAAVAGLWVFLPYLLK